MIAQAGEVPVRPKARLAGAFYLAVFLAGAVAVLATGGLFTLSNAAATANNILLHEQRFWLGFTFNLIVIVSYLVVTALFYDLFRHVSRPLSLNAALFSVVGCAVQAAALVFYAAPWIILSGSKYGVSLSTGQSQTLALLGLQLYVQAYNIGLAFFGCYCLLIGYLIFQSGFLPRVLGVLMMFGGLSWLTFLSPPLASYLRPYNIAPGVLGEGSLTLWLLLVGVNAQKWVEKASAR
jgi:small-conductance mechanosensitive channel